MAIYNFVVVILVATSDNCDYKPHTSCKKSEISNLSVVKIPVIEGNTFLLINLHGIKTLLSLTCSFGEKNFSLKTKNCKNEVWDFAIIWNRCIPFLLGGYCSLRGSKIYERKRGLSLIPKFLDTPYARQNKRERKRRLP